MGERPLAPLIAARGLQAVFEAINQDGDVSWLVGGCVRNTLLGEAVKDIDVATQASPQEVIARAEAAGLRAVPTGLDHGTVTLVHNGEPIEVTTLRKDVETDGRHAVVVFTRDIAEDAARRDFTMNALYADETGAITDPVGGLDDLAARRVRFIGQPADRIAEDYLRILRFFRFYGWYGHGAPDRFAVRAIVTNKGFLTGLSAERVWAELKKILAAPNVTRALLWMRQSGVYQVVLPESGDMDGFARFMLVEDATELAPDPLLRLMALLSFQGPNRIKALATRLKLSNAERDRLVDARAVYEALKTDELSTQAERRLALYEHGVQPVRDVTILQTAHALPVDPERADEFRLSDRVRDLLALSDGYDRPSLPVSGDDLLQRGIPSGPQVGASLQLLEAAWKASDFTLSRDDLLAVLKNQNQLH
ncbi:MAG: CCA tRNA nucleotidyltransferase [Pseudomonadota bacterium]